MNLHTQVKNYILDHIHSGEWEIGMQIPTEESLAKTLLVSRPTVRQALSILTSEGYLERTKRRGTFVRQPKLLHQSTSMLASYREESKRNGFNIRTKVLRNEIIKSGDFIAEKLNLSSALKKVTVLTRLRYLEGYKENKPVVYTTLYVPYDVFPDLSELDFTDVSFYEVLEEKNLMVIHADRELEVILPEEEVCDALLISRFEPVIFIKSQGTAKESLTIEYSESYYPASFSKFHIHMDR